MLRVWWVGYMLVHVDMLRSELVGRRRTKRVNIPILLTRRKHVGEYFVVVLDVALIVQENGVA